MSIILKFENIDAVLDELYKRRQAYNLREQVHLEHGAYGQYPIPDELRCKINNFFGFDDSE